MAPGRSQAEWPGAPRHRVWVMGDQKAPISLQMGGLSALFTQSPQKVVTGPLGNNGKGSSLCKFPKDRLVGHPEPSPEELPLLSHVGSPPDRCCTINPAASPRAQHRPGLCPLYRLRIRVAPGDWKDNGSGWRPSGRLGRDAAPLAA